MTTKQINIQGRIITIPEPERHERHLIINVDQKKDQAFWRRQEDIPRLFYDYNPATKINQQHTLYDPNEGHLTHLSEKDTKMVSTFLQRELYRRTHGVHMKNGEDIVWIHPDYYFNLQWAPMLGLQSKWGAFRWFQNDYLIDRGHNIQDPNVAGLFCTKPKKTGISQILAGAYVNESTMSAKREFGMMSKTGDDVKDVCMNFFFYIFDELPYILKPKVAKRNLSEIKFGLPAGRASGTKSSLLANFKNQRSAALNTHIFASPTKESGFDGPLMYRGWVDEFPKTWEGSSISPDAMYKKTIETVKQQMHIYGFLDYTSYAPEIDDRGFEEAKKIWNNSKDVKKETGRTETNMVTHFISVLDAMEGQYDVYGRCDHRKTLHFIKAELASKSETSEKQRIKRQYPVDETDSWGAGGTGTTFNNVRLGEIHGEVEKDVLKGQEPYEQGRFKWSNEEWENGTVERPKGQFCPVIWEPLSDKEKEMKMEGRVKRFHEIPHEHMNAALLADNRHEDDDKLCPLLDTIYVGSFDPTDYKKKKDVQEGSKNAGHTMNLQSSFVDTYFQETASNILLSEYFYRPDHPDEAYEDLVKEIIFFGKYVLVEANKGWVVTKLIDDGLIHFLLFKKSDGSIGPYMPGDDQTYTYTTDQLIDDYCREISLYIAEPKLQGAPDYGKSLKSLNLLKQLMNFEPLNTKKYDLAVSLGLCRLAVRAFSVYRAAQLESQGGTYSKDALEAALELLD
jgi:hypothetical protein